MTEQGLLLFMCAMGGNAKTNGHAGVPLATTRNAIEIAHGGPGLSTPSRIPAGAWPRQMNTAYAAGYCGEPTVEALLRGVKEGIYPNPTEINKRGKRWLKDDLDQALERLHRQPGADAADLL